MNHLISDNYGLPSPFQPAMELQGFRRRVWFLFMTTLMISLAGCILSLFAMFADTFDSLFPLKIMVTSITILFASILGLLTTCLAGSINRHKLTTLVFGLSLATLILGTTSWIDILWNMESPIVRWEGFLTSFVLFPICLFVLKLIDCPARSRES